MLSTVERHCPIYDILPAEARVTFTPRPFADRRDIGFVAGWLAGPTSPNADGLRWFVGEVLPRVTAVLPWIRLRVTGGSVPAEIRALASPNLIFEGQVPDISAFYYELRLAVAPLRFGAGVKLKTVQALQPYFGSPNQPGIGNNSVQNVEQDNEANQFTIRGDQMLPHNENLGLRFTKTHSGGFIPNILGSPGVGRTEPLDS